MKKAIHFIIIFLFTLKVASQQKLTTVDASLLEYKKVEYGINKLNLLIFPSMEKIRDDILIKAKSGKCKVYIKLKINSKTKVVSKEKIVSTCKFEDSFNVEKYFENQVFFYITEINTMDNSNEINIPIYIEGSN